MSNTINTGGPAFPVTKYDPEFEQYFTEGGMTLRDYIAIHASEEDVKAMGEVIREQGRQGYVPGVLPDGWQSKARYMHADNMLRARGEG